MTAVAQSKKAESLYNTAVALLKADRYDEAIPVFLRCYDLGTKEYTLAALSGLGLCHYYKEDYESALPIFEKLLPEYEESYWSGYCGYDDYLLVINCLCECYEYMGRAGESLPLREEACMVCEIELEDNHPDYLSALYESAFCHLSVGLIDDAIILYNELLERIRLTDGENSSGYARSLDFLAQCYDELGYYEKALSVYGEALHILEDTLGKDCMDYVTTMQNMAICYLNAGETEKAVLLFQEALDICEDLLGTQSLEYAEIIANYALCFDEIGDYDRALSLQKEVLKIKERVLGKKHPDYANTLNNIASCYAFMDRTEEATDLLEEVIAIMEGSMGRDNLHCATYINNLASCYDDLGNYEKAIALYEEALSISRRIYGSDHPDNMARLENIAFCYEEQGDFEKALSFYNEALQIQTVTGASILDRGLLKSVLAITYSNVNDKSAAVLNASEASELLTNDIVRKFGFLTSHERELYLEQYRGWFDAELQGLTYRFPYDSLVITGYNAALFNKGLLLNTEREFKSLIEESEDQEAMEMYEQLRLKRLQVDRLMEQPIWDRGMDVDSLETLTRDVERKLIARSKAFGNYTRNLSVDWKQVQGKLKSDEVAVEYVTFPVGEDSLMYAAYVVKPGMEAPAWVPLFESARLSTIPARDYYTTSSVSELAWKPLESYLDGVNTVYFAPSGQFYNIAIESVPDWESDGSIVSDNRVFRRLSSTRELVLATDPLKWKEAVIYGGLKYNMEEEELVSDSRKYRDVDGVDFSAPIHLADSLHLRAGVAYLPGTLDEALNIKATLEKASIHTETYIDTLGTETSFKHLSGKGINVMHIGTHGFYYSHEVIPGASMRMYFNNFKERHSRYNREELSMERSGLLFAGADYALKGNSLPEGVDDGILTATELAKMDLRGLDLVALSACQTGLGEIAGDGVFGLQRGFKKAGANALLMSLWKVDDVATELLMTRFFTNLAEGKSKHVALLEAQKYVREYETDCPESAEDPYFKLAQDRQETPVSGERCHPYASPYYWAAFILLDGLE